jgi:hypothetical protein
MNETKICLVTLISPYLFNHLSLYGLTCLNVIRFNFLTKIELVILVQLSLSIIILHILLSMKHLV